jgi:hypothetical protein
MPPLSHFDFLVDIDCTPLPVGTKPVVGHDVLHMAPPSRDTVLSSSAPLA